MYEYLLENLISFSQIESNLRRTADKGLVSELYRKQMNALALKYFGVDKNGNYTDNKEEIVSYRCPYSGELIKDLSATHLEHILPVTSNGGTVLFNCIPVLGKVNSLKSAEPNLITWWQGKGKEYFSYDRLERLIQYMLEAYTLSFKEPSEEYLYDYDSSIIYDNYIENDDLSIDLSSKSNKFKSSNQNITYYQLLVDMINELSKNRDVSQYNMKLNDIKVQDMFDNIEEIEKIIKIVQTVFKEVLGDDSKKYLSFSLKIDMYKLLKSLDTTNYEQEIRKRFEYIQLISEQNNISINDYFENLQDIDDINLIYFDISKITDQQKTNFIENIQIGHNTKILLFIDMIRKAKNKDEIAELFKVDTPKKFTTYKKNENGDWVVDKEYGPIGKFWSHKNNKDKIKPILDQISLEDIELREKLDDYYMNTRSGQMTEEGKQRRIDIFIDMIRKAKNKDELVDLFKSDIPKKFTTYKKNENGDWVVDKEYGPIGKFWSHNKDKIKPILETENELREKLDDYYMNTQSGQMTEEGNQRRIDIFIDMLRKAKTKEEMAELFKSDTPKKFTTYKENENGDWIVDKEYGVIGYFWSRKINKDKIKPILETENELREKLDDYYMNTQSGQMTEEGKQRRIDIFVDMIRKAKNKDELVDLFKADTPKKFTTYKENENGDWIENKKYGVIGTFWSTNKPKIKPILDQISLEDIELREKLDDYYMNTYSGQITEEGKQRRKEIFIDMIRKAKTKEEVADILKQDAQRKFTTYKKNENGDWVVDKEYGPIGKFWSRKINKDKIKPILETENELREKLDDYYMNTYNGQRSEEGNQRRIDIFIDMLRKAKTKEEIAELFKDRTKKIFTSYKKNENGDWVVDKEYGPIGNFWSSSYNKIKPILDQISLEDIELREKLDDYYMNTYNGQMSEEGKQRRIDIFIDMIRKAKNKDELVDLFKSDTPKKFTTYKENENGDWIVDKEYGPIGYFWHRSNNKNKIISQLFFSKEYENEEYDIARQRIIDNLNSNRRKKKLLEFKSINDYIDTLDKTKKETKILIGLRNSLIAKKQQLKIENNELNQQINISVRRAI